MTCVDATPLARAVFPVRDYDLAATLDSGQAFRWRRAGEAWQGVVAGRWVRLRQTSASIAAEAMESPGDWDWLCDYLQLEVDLAAVLATFPIDEPMRAAADACCGLRLLRQEPWECLASFICSSTKQIVQIRQMVAELCRRRGEPLIAPAEAGGWFSFPSVEQIACSSEAELRACKLGFRAPNLLASARMIAAGELNLARLATLPFAEARAELMRLPGVGPKIADCVLLFAYGFPEAFPVDVWVSKALRELYFPRRHPSPQRMARFIESYFGPHAGYAQQYLFHFMRTRKTRVSTVG